MSQQIPRERLDGQVTQQINMVSDTVTNVRRRPGAKFEYYYPCTNSSPDTVVAFPTSLGGQDCHFIINTSSGQLITAFPGTGLSGPVYTSPYLVAASTRSIRGTTVGDEFFLLNTEKVPTLVHGAADQSYRKGFFQVTSGVFSKTYAVSVTTTDGVSYSVTYTTPDGTHTGDAALASPINIAQQLALELDAISPSTFTAQFDSYALVNRKDCASIFIQQATTVPVTVAAGLAVTTSSGPQYITTSSVSFLRDVSALPATFGGTVSNFDGYIIKTGSVDTPVYYAFSAAKQAWLECGEPNAPTGISNMPVSITNTAGTWAMNSTQYEGRTAGDSDSNEDPAFIPRGITGMGTYQGRLVLLAGPQVLMSASGKPRRFYRSTVTSVLDGDTIGIGASSAQAASFQYAVQFAKDLLLFSSQYQAVISGTNGAVTPRTAAVTVVSKYAADVTSSPVDVGRTVMFQVPAGKNNFALMELVGSVYADSTYTAYDSSTHLPFYMAGNCKLAVSGTATRMVLFLPTGEPNTIVVNEYTWSGNNKVQQAWYKWTFAYPVVSAMFSGQTLYLLFARGNSIIGLSLDAHQRVYGGPAYNAPLDFSSTIPVVNGVPQGPSGGPSVPDYMRNFDALMPAQAAAAVATGPLASEPVALSTAGGYFYSSPSYQNGSIVVGLPFTSVLEPTPPMKKDHNGVAVSTNKATVVRFAVGVSNSREFQISIGDTHGDPTVYSESPLTYSSTELELGQALVGGPDSVVVVPARTLADSTSLVLSSAGTGDMNIVSLEYAMRYREKIKRSLG